MTRGRQRRCAVICNVWISQCLTRAVHGTRFKIGFIYTTYWTATIRSFMSQQCLQPLPSYSLNVKRRYLFGSDRLGRHIRLTDLEKCHSNRYYGLTAHSDLGVSKTIDKKKKMYTRFSPK